MFEKQIIDAVRDKSWGRAQQLAEAALVVEKIAERVESLAQLVEDVKRTDGRREAEQDADFLLPMMHIGRQAQAMSDEVREFMGIEKAGA
jgi:hypothetical protein